MKVIQLKNLSPSGYKRYDKFDQDQTNAIKIIASRFFTYSAKKAEHFVKALEMLYKNPNSKIILDIIAIHILTKDSLIITYGFGCGDKLGHYVFNPVKSIKGVSEGLIEKHTTILEADKKALASEIINLILKLQTGVDNTVPTYETIDISAQRLHDKLEHLAGTILHELSHLAMDILFDKKSLGFSTDEEYIVAEKSFREMLLKVLSIVDPLGHDYYPSLNVETLSSVLHKNVSSLDHQMDESLHVDDFDVKGFKEILKTYKDSGIGRIITVLNISDASYPSSFLVNSELFARACQLFASQEKFPLVDKILKDMEPYYNGVLLPKVIEYIKKNPEQSNLLDINTEVMRFKIGDSQYTPQEKSFFALVNGNTEEFKKLCLENKIDANSKVFDLYKLGHLAILLNNNAALEMLSKYNEIDLITKDALSFIEEMENKASNSFESLTEEESADELTDIIQKDPGILVPECTHKDASICE